MYSRKKVCGKYTKKSENICSGFETAGTKADTTDHVVAQNETKIVFENEQPKGTQPERVSGGKKNCTRQLKRDDDIAPTQPQLAPLFVEFPCGNFERLSVSEEFSRSLAAWNENFCFIDGNYLDQLIDDLTGRSYEHQRGIES